MGEAFVSLKGGCCGTIVYYLVACGPRAGWLGNPCGHQGELHDWRREVVANSGDLRDRGRGHLRHRIHLPALVVPAFRSLTDQNADPRRSAFLFV